MTCLFVENGCSGWFGSGALQFRRAIARSGHSHFSFTSRRKRNSSNDNLEERGRETLSYSPCRRSSITSTVASNQQDDKRGKKRGFLFLPLRCARRARINKSVSTAAAVVIFSCSLNAHSSSRVRARVRTLARSIKLVCPFFLSFFLPLI